MPKVSAILPSEAWTAVMGKAFVKGSAATRPRFMTNEGPITNIIETAFKTTAAVINISCFLMPPCVFALIDLIATRRMIKMLIWNRRFKSARTDALVPRKPVMSSYINNAQILFFPSMAKLGAKQQFSVGENLLTETKARECTIPISRFLSLRLYPDNRPCNRFIAGLQKGLVFVYQGKEMIGEGTGFGVPIVRYGDKTYFPGSATMQIFQRNGSTVATKDYALNMVSEKTFGGAKIDNRLMHRLARLQEAIYQKHRQLSPIMLRSWHMSNRIGVRINFVQRKPIGDVLVTYQVDSQIVHVKADFRLTEKNRLQRIFLLNEQGARFFRKYYDSNNTVLFDEEIGAWEKVEADWACVSDKGREAGFRLWTVKDSILHRGREFLAGSLDWIGLDYEAGPDRTNFGYEIETFGSSKPK